MVLTVAAIASLLVMAMNVNTWNANAIELSKFKDFQGIDDIGQSAECVIVVVGCDGQGSVGSSGDVNVGSGDDDTNTNGNGGNTPLPPINQEDCAVCLAALSPEQLVSLRAALQLGTDATLLEICAALDLVATVGALVVLLDGIGLSAQAIVDLLACLDIEISLDAVLAILL